MTMAPTRSQSLRAAARLAAGGQWAVANESVSQEYRRPASARRAGPSLPAAPALTQGNPVAPALGNAAPTLATASHVAATAIRGLKSTSTIVWSLRDRRDRGI